MCSLAKPGGGDPCEQHRNTERGYRKFSYRRKGRGDYFHQYDLMANWSLPWGWYSPSGWGVGTRLMGSVGAVTASGDAAFISTVIPGVVFEKKDGWLSLEVGGGSRAPQPAPLPRSRT